MAYVIDDKKGDTSTVSSTPLSSGPQPNTQQQGQSTAPTPVTQAPQSQPQEASQSSSKPKSNSSGMFTNIQKYVAKNKPQSEKMATESRNYVEEAKKDAQKASDTALAGFKTQTEASGLHNTADRVGEVSQYTTEQSGMNPVAPDPQAQPLVSKPPVAEIDENQFSNIVNAQYTGPQSLVETGNLYSDLSKQAKESSRIGDLAQSTKGRGQLLKDIYTTGTNEYGSGASNLDNYLLGKQSGALEDIRGTGQAIGSQQDIMKNASRQATGQAKNISDLIAGTRADSRAAFGDIAGKRQGQVDDRVGDIVKNWDLLPEHFRKAFTSEDGSPNISAIEANIAGVQSGEGLYGMQGKDLFAEKGTEGYIDPVTGQLISKGESGNLQRLQALSNMARTKDKLYDIENSDYSNTEQAGTQSAMDALNLGRVREKLAEKEREFRDFAGKDVTGKGSDYERYDAGWGKTKKKHASAEQTSSLKNVLADQGYDFDSEVSTADKSNFGLIKDLARLSQDTTPEGYINSLAPGSVDAEGLMDTGDEILSGQAGLLLDRLKIKPSDLAGIKTISNITDEVGRFGDNVGGVGGDIISGVADIGSNLTGNIGNTLDKGFSNVFGGGKQAAYNKAKQGAQRKALADLKAKMNDRYKASNFDKRINVDDASTAQNDQDLMKLLAGMDQTNVNEEV